MTIPHYDNLDLTGHQLLNFKVQVLASDPPLGEARLWYNSTAKVLRYYNGTSVVDLVASGVASDANLLNGNPGSHYLNRANHVGTQPASSISDFNTAVRGNRLNEMAAPVADVSMNSNKITNVANPTIDSDAANRGYVEARISELVGSSPAVLNTLNELASALGNDPNFAVTISNQLGSLDTRLDSVEAILAEGVSRRVEATVGDAVNNSFTVTHNFGIDYPLVNVYRTTDKQQVQASIRSSTVNAIIVSFGTYVPTAGEFRVVIGG